MQLPGTRVLSNDSDTSTACVMAAASNCSSPECIEGVGSIVVIVLLRFVEGIPPPRLPLFIYLFFLFLHQARVSDQQVAAVDHMALDHGETLPGHGLHPLPS